MEFIEYPKALYLAGQQMIVDDAEQEEAARADGYDDWQADHARIEGADAGAGEQPLDRDALKAEAKALGLEFTRNISTDQLAALVAGAKQ